MNDTRLVLIPAERLIPEMRKTSIGGPLDPEGYAGLLEFRGIGNPATGVPYTVDEVRGWAKDVEALRERGL